MGTKIRNIVSAPTYLRGEKRVNTEYVSMIKQDVETEPEDREGDTRTLPPLETKTILVPI